MWIDERDMRVRSHMSARQVHSATSFFCVLAGGGAPASVRINVGCTPRVSRTMSLLFSVRTDALCTTRQISKWLDCEKPSRTACSGSVQNATVLP